LALTAKGCPAAIHILESAILRFVMFACQDNSAVLRHIRGESEMQPVPLHIVAFDADDLFRVEASINAVFRSRPPASQTSSTPLETSAKKVPGAI
jgi:hypothetical protein